MISTNEKVLEFTLLRLGSDSVFGNNIWVADDFPEGYDPATDGTGVVLVVRGGETSYSRTMRTPDILVRIAATADPTAVEADEAFFRAMDAQRGYTVRSIWQTTQGQLITDGSTTWPTVVSYYRAIVPT